MVLQKNTLFSGTLKENLLWGDQDASQEEIEEACRIAGADEFIGRLETAMIRKWGRAASMSPAARSSGSASPAPS